MIYKYPLISLALGAIAAGGFCVWNFFNGDSSVNLDSDAPVFKFEVEESKNLEITPTPQTLKQIGAPGFGPSLPDKSKFPLNSESYKYLWNDYKSKNIGDEKTSDVERKSYLNSVGSFLSHIPIDIASFTSQKLTNKEQDLYELMELQRALTDFYIDYSKALFNLSK